VAAVAKRRRPGGVTMGVATRSRAFSREPSLDMRIPTLCLIGLGPRFDEDVAQEFQHSNHA
jgi:hypothetical protein